MQGEVVFFHSEVFVIWQYFSRRVGLAGSPARLVSSSCLPGSEKHQANVTVKPLGFNWTMSPLGYNVFGV